jgi:hypothetical protein
MNYNDNVEMNQMNQQKRNNTGGQVHFFDNDKKYDWDQQQNSLPCPKNVFYTEPGSYSSTPLMPASMEQQGSINVPLFILS